MSTSVKVTEYYDVFDVKTVLTYPDTRAITAAQNTDVPDTDTSVATATNTFRGFNSFPITDAVSSIQNPNAGTNNLKQQYIAMEHVKKAPQAINNISIDDAGNILCYPPNISVPYWDRVVFKHFDYDINPATSYNGPYKGVIESYLNTVHDVTYPEVSWRVDDDVLAKDNPDMRIPIPEEYWNTNQSAAAVPEPFKRDFTGVTGRVHDYNIRDFRNVPVFIKYDMYPSRSKVVYSSADKWNQNSSDIVHKFNYHHGQMEPLKLSVTLSASNPATNPNLPAERYNQQLTYTDIQNLFKKCYWSIEWIYDRTSGN